MFYHVKITCYHRAHGQATCPEDACYSSSIATRGPQIVSQRARRSLGCPRSSDEGDTEGSSFDSWNGGKRPICVKKMAAASSNDQASWENQQVEAVAASDLLLLTLDEDHKWGHNSSNPTDRTGLVFSQSAAIDGAFLSTVDGDSPTR